MKITSWISILCLAATATANLVHAAAPKAIVAIDKQSLREYGQVCAETIGRIEPFDCLKGTIVPITVDGKTPSAYTSGMTCDRPALLPYGPETFGQCTPYSRILDLSRGKTQISAFCRREYLRDPDSPMFDEVDIIAHDADSGKTCWFHAQGKPGQKSGFDASRVPPPNEKTPPPKRIAANHFWWSPAATAKKNCASCHDADPFMYSPWIGQVRHLVPADPLGRYINVGKDFASWHSNGISTRDNTCVGCHRIGNQASCSTFIPMATGQMSAPGGNALANSYPLNHWMPINNDQSQEFWTKANLESLQKIMTCCEDPKNPICTITPIITPDRGAKR